MSKDMANLYIQLQHMLQLNNLCCALRTVRHADTYKGYFWHPISVPWVFLLGPHAEMGTQTTKQ